MRGREKKDAAAGVGNIKQVLSSFGALITRFAFALHSIGNNIW